MEALGEVDCHWYAEAQAELLAALRSDRSAWRSGRVANKKTPTGGTDRSLLVFIGGFSHVKRLSRLYMAEESVELLSSGASTADGGLCCSSGKSSSMAVVPRLTKSSRASRR